MSGHDDGLLIELVAKIFEAAQNTEDERIHGLATAAYEQLAKSPTAMGTLLLRYNHLQTLEDKGEFAGLQLDPEPNLPQSR